MGRGRLRRRCDRCIHESRSTRLNCNRNHILKHKKAFCEDCGFVAVHPCQLDVDHIDGNRANDDPVNFRTLCANCHRLKTHINGDNLFFNKHMEHQDKQKELLL